MNNSITYPVPQPINYPITPPSGAMMADKKKILYVEDDPLNKIFIRKALNIFGYEVVEADNGLSSVSIALNERPDLVLMDINMPGMDGYEASTLIKGVPELEEVPIVAFTAKHITQDD
ncbi:MAG: response regulator, partial [Chloroflexota bacterium]